MNTLNALPQDVLSLILDYSRNPAAVSSVSRRLRGIAAEWLKKYNQSLLNTLPPLVELIKPTLLPKQQFMVLCVKINTWSQFYNVIIEEPEVAKKHLFDSKCFHAQYNATQLAIYLFNPHRNSSNDLRAAREIAKKNRIYLKENKDGEKAWNELIAYATRITRFLSKGDLAENRLIRIPCQIGQLTHLHQIDLSNNRISEIPPQIAQLQMLQSLNLSYNWLESVPKEIGNLTNLVLLNLNDNRCKVLPPQLTQLVNLRHLLVRNNRLTFLPDLRNLPRLEELKASGNRFSEARVAKSVDNDLNSCVIS